MDPRTNFYPVYVSGQYLTSEHLNETHNFLWQEEKATRTFLAGNGIAQGLQPGFDDNTMLKHISLSAGVAATIDGYLVQADDNTTFNRAAPVNLVSFTTNEGWHQFMEKKDFDAAKKMDTILAGSNKDINTLEIFANTVADKDLPDGAASIESFAVTPNDAVANRLLMAWVYINDAENNHCQQGDCNTKGTQRNYITRYFFIDATFFTRLNFVSPELSTCSVARIKKLSLSGSLVGLNQRSFTAWGKSFAELQPYFSNDAARQLMEVAKLLDPDDLAKLANSSTIFTQVIQGSVNTASCPQYYNLFAADLAKAINELVCYYNEYAKKYPTIAPARIERTIIVGSLASIGIDKWRYYFVESPGLIEDRFDKWKLQRMFRRVLAMIDNFIPQNAIVASASLVPARPLAIPTLAGDSLLQNGAIPYYFDISTLTANENKILAHWNPQGGNLKNIYSYYDSVVPSRNDMGNKLTIADWYNNNFFRIEGHVGMNKTTAISVINNLIVNEGLPVQLIDCDINYKGPVKWINWYADFVGNMDTWVKQLRTNYKDYDFGPMKNIQANITQTSYRSVDEVVKVLNDFNAYSGVFYNPPKPSVQGISARAKARAVVTPLAKSGIPTTAYTQFTKVVDKNAVLDVNKRLKDALAEQNDLQARKLIVLSDLSDLEYLGGVVRGGTFVLLHDGVNVIGDGSLAYFYRINQTRVFNAAT